MTGCILARDLILCIDVVSKQVCVGLDDKEAGEITAWDLDGVDINTSGPYSYEYPSVLLGEYNVRMLRSQLE